MPREKGKKDLPKGVEDLPEHAKEIYRKAHNNALKQYTLKNGGAGHPTRQWLIRLHGQPSRRNT